MEDVGADPPASHSPPLKQFSHGSDVPEVSVLHQTSLFLQVLLHMDPHILSHQSENCIHIDLLSDLQQIRNVLLQRLLPPAYQTDIPELLSLSYTVKVHMSSLLLPERQNLYFCL